MLRSWIYPPRCILCGELLSFGTEFLVCGRCRISEYALKGPRCVICSRPVQQANDKCYSCSMYENRIPGQAAFAYKGAIALALRDFKYLGMRSYAPTMAQLMLRERRERLPETFFLVPVPIHRSRLRERGYNQALQLALSLGKLLQVPVCECLVRRERTKALKKLGAGERRSSMAHVIEAADQVLPPGTAILVDDIYTSGSTVESCARALKEKWPDLPVGFWTFSIRE